MTTNQLVLSEKLLSEWHPTKNKDLSPSEESYGSYEYIWWKCGEGHEFGMTIRERYNKHLECPECLKAERSKKRKAEKEDNQERSLFEMDYELSKQWHPTLNNDITPKDVPYNERRSRWWICKRGHEWQESIKERFNNSKSVCVYCSDQKAYEGNCLATIHPNLASEWFIFKNDRTPYEVVYNATYEAHWVCRAGHVWKERVNKRVKNDPGCPKCKELKTCLAVMNPEIAEEWHPDKNTGFYYSDKKTPFDVQYNSWENAWWKCKKCGNDFSARVKERTKGEAKCNVCFPVVAKSRSASPGAFKTKTSRSLEDDRMLFEKNLREQKNKN